MFEERELVDLTIAIGLMNTYNRLASVVPQAPQAAPGKLRRAKRPTKELAMKIFVEGHWRRRPAARTVARDAWPSGDWHDASGQGPDRLRESGPRVFRRCLDREAVYRAIEAARRTW